MRLFCSLAAPLLILTACGGKPVETQSTGSPSDSIVASDPRSSEFKAATQERLEAMQKEEAVRESAPWFGKTGLADDVERELPRYLRREYGQLLSEPGALQAGDLEYLGLFSEGVESVHYWLIHDRAKAPHYAYVVAAPEEHRSMGWGDRSPPK